MLVVPLARVGLVRVAPWCEVLFSFLKREGKGEPWGRLFIWVFVYLGRALFFFFKTGREEALGNGLVNGPCSFVTVGFLF